MSALYTVHCNPDPANSRRPPPPTISPCMFLIGFRQNSGSSLAPVGGAVALPRGDANNGSKTPPLPWTRSRHHAMCSPVTSARALTSIGTAVSFDMFPLPHLRPCLTTGLAVLWFFLYSKQVFGPRTAKSQPIWIKFCTHLLFRDLRNGNFRSNRISNRTGGYDSNSNRISNRIRG